MLRNEDWKPYTIIMLVVSNTYFSNMVIFRTVKQDGKKTQMINNIPIYHITHLDNFPNILQHKSLFCDKERISQGLDSVSIAYKELKQRRLQIPVPIAACGVLGDYVPFYFCNRAPMLLAIHTSSVKGFGGKQEDIIYLVSSVNRVIKERKQSWCFTDGHAVEEFTDFYDSIDQLDQIDWETIGDWSWKNTDEDPDKKRRKQAEFLVYKKFPLSLIEKIGVYSDKQKIAIEAMLGENQHQLPINVEKKWYYNT